MRSFAPSAFFRIFICICLKGGSSSVTFIKKDCDCRYCLYCRRRKCRAVRCCCLEDMMCAGSRNHWSYSSMLRVCGTQTTSARGGWKTSWTVPCPMKLTSFSITRAMANQSSKTMTANLWKVSALSAWKKAIPWRMSCRTPIRTWA